MPLADVVRRSGRRAPGVTVIVEGASSSNGADGDRVTADLGNLDAGTQLFCWPGGRGTSGNAPGSNPTTSGFGTSQAGAASAVMLGGSSASSQRIVVAGGGGRNGSSGGSGSSGANGQSGQEGTRVEHGSGEPQTTTQVNAAETRSWRTVQAEGWRSDNDRVYQGDFDGFGNHRGCWFYGTRIRNLIAGREVVSARMWLSRQNAGGSSAPQTLTFYTHNMNEQPSGTGQPSLFTGGHNGPALGWGSQGLFDIPPAILQDIANVSSRRGIAIHRPNGSNYLFLRGKQTRTRSGELRITHRPSPANTYTSTGGRGGNGGAGGTGGAAGQGGAAGGGWQPGSPGAAGSSGADGNGGGGGGGGGAAVYSPGGMSASASGGQPGVGGQGAVDGSSGSSGTSASSSSGTAQGSGGSGGSAGGPGQGVRTGANGSPGQSGTATNQVVQGGRGGGGGHGGSGTSGSAGQRGGNGSAHVASWVDLVSHMTEAHDGLGRVRVFEDGELKATFEASGSAQAYTVGQR